MATAPFTNVFDSAAGFYLNMVESALHASERSAKLSRLMMDESLGAQQEFARSIRQAYEDGQKAFATAAEPASPMQMVSRAGEMARAGYAAWTEAGLKAQERWGRISQAAMEEMKGAQGEFSSFAQQGYERFATK